MSVTAEKLLDPTGDSTHVTEAWELKEQIRKQDDVLKQRRGFFTDAYRRANCHLLVEDDSLVAFASVRRDGYILFLAVGPWHRGLGYGERLIAEVADNHRSITCHARTSNEEALGFYEHLGFEVKRRINGYYEDSGDAYYLKLGENTLRQRLSDFVH